MSTFLMQGRMDPVLIDSDAVTKHLRKCIHGVGAPLIVMHGDRNGSLHTHVVKGGDVVLVVRRDLMIRAFKADEAATINVFTTAVARRVKGS